MEKKPDLKRDHEIDEHRRLLDVAKGKLVTLLNENPSLDDPRINELLPEQNFQGLRPGTPIPGVASNLITQGGVLRKRQLQATIATHERALQPEAASTANEGASLEQVVPTATVEPTAKNARTRTWARR